MSHGSAIVYSAGTWGDDGRPLKTVGVVDDDPSIRKSLKRLLETAGYCAHTFDSGEALLAYAAIDTLDLLVIDVVLGGLSGIELLHELEMRAIHKPALLITARSDDEMPGRLALPPQVPVLRKPFGAHSLLAAVASLV